MRRDIPNTRLRHLLILFCIRKRVAMNNVELIFNLSELLLKFETALVAFENKQMALLKEFLPESSLFLMDYSYKHFGFICLWLSFVLVISVALKCCQKQKPSLHENSQEKDYLFDLAKTAYEMGHTKATIRLIEKLHYDVNDRLPSTGLTLFLCACLSGTKELIHYMLKKGANLKSATNDGDSVLYLTTFGVLNSKHPDLSVLEMLISAGCEINRANKKGFTPLHQAANKGNVQIIKFLLSKGANPYKCNKAGTYPIDSAVNAGHLEAAELLKINVANYHLWEVVDPHTPTRIQLGLQSPQRRLLLESSKPRTLNYILRS